jgi:hypothetical protein
MERSSTKFPWLDSVLVAAQRAVAAPMKGKLGATAARDPFNSWFNLGTARSFRNFVGHIALSAGADTFIPDYRLALEHPFLAAIEDLSGHSIQEPAVSTKTN